ncbi:hypothetical protein RJ640_016277 [Escallonia rubra]|uniref:GAG-pre-integrase domain-containing protein n=1 Tax=Escallonia rubra TaxID=112253 RepID=A0AA88U3A1_9ASTE|nr:hypothetical protein RJ640_016277 [Escallonia rubra]
MHDAIVRTLTDVRHIPELRSNLISLGAVAETSASDIHFDTSKLWHMRLGHMSERDMYVPIKQGLLGSKKTRKLDFYEHCAFGKQCRVKFSQAKNLELEPPAPPSPWHRGFGSSIAVETKATIGVLSIDADDGKAGRDQIDSS